LSHSSKKSVRLHDYVAAAKDDVNLVFVNGTMAHGKIVNDYTDDFISGYSDTERKPELTNLGRLTTCN
ncbi:hypothetical protein FRX31_025864, partial [Thalictrum thalictroides]